MSNKDNFTSYIKKIKNYSAYTINNYKKDIENYELFLKKNNQQVFNIDDETIHSYLRLLHNSNFKKSTISRKLSAIRSYYNFLEKEHIVKTNPFRDIKNPKLEKKLPNFINDNDLDKIFQIPNIKKPLGQRNRLIIEMLYATGIRVSELVNIKIEDINVDNESIKIFGKGRKERYVFFGNYAKEILELYLKDSRKKLLKNNQNNYLFLNINGRPITDRSIRNIINDIIEKCSLDLKVSPHTLRHTFATHMLNEGADILNVKELLGHSSLETTSIYTHVTNERIKEVYFKTHPRAKE